MKPKYKVKITKAYLIEIVDKTDKTVDEDWSFLEYTETKKRAEKMLSDYVATLERKAELESED